MHIIVGIVGLLLAIAMLYFRLILIRAIASGRTIALHKPGRGKGPDLRRAFAEEDDWW
jgi:hypothetical protein